MKGRKIHTTPLGWVVLFSVLLICNGVGVALAIIYDDNIIFALLGEIIGGIIVGILFGGAYSDD